MAHQTMKETEITLRTENIPEGYALTLCFLVKGNHPLDIHVTEKHLDDLMLKIQEFKQMKSSSA
jgi:hypothetical protein